MQKEKKDEVMSDEYIARTLDFILNHFSTQKNENKVSFGPAFNLEVQHPWPLYAQTGRLAAPSGHIKKRQYPL
jgi:glycogen synthase